MAKGTFRLMLIFIIFILLRLYVPFGEKWVGGDEARYLELADHFPEHTLFADKLYLAHQPLYPYTIFLVSLVAGNLYLAGIIVSLAAAIATYFVLVLLLRLLEIREDVMILAMLFFSLSYEAGFYATNITKESFSMLLTFLALYFYIKGLKKDKKFFLHSAVSGVLYAFSSDHVIFLFPMLVLAFVFYRKKKTRLVNAAMPLIASGAAYGIWIGIRLYVYATNAYYPAGLEGIVENVGSFGLMQLISPFTFPNTSSILFNGSAFTLTHLGPYLGYLINLYPFVIKILPNSSYSAASVWSLLGFRQLAFILAFYLPLIGFMAYGSYIAMRNRSNGLFFMLLGAIMLIPITQPVSIARYSLYAVVPFGMMFAIGFSSLLERWVDMKKVIAVIIVAVLVFVFFWVRSNNLIFDVEERKDGALLAEYLELLPAHTVMAQTGYNLKIAYTTNKTTLSLPPQPAELLEQVKQYGVDYVVYGQCYWAPIREENRDRIWDYETIRYIQNHPEHFKFLRVVDDYCPPSTEKNDRIYIYETR